MISDLAYHFQMKHKLIDINLDWLHYKGEVIHTVLNTKVGRKVLNIMNFLCINLVKTKYRLTHFQIDFEQQ